MEFTFNQLRIFCAIVEEGSITRAAKILHLTQPAVSIQLKQLEEHLETSLLIRERNGISVLLVGDMLYKHARVILEQQQRFKNILNENKINTIEQLRIGATTGTLYHLTPIISSFNRLFSSGIQVTLTTNISDEIQLAAESREIDIGFTWETTRSQSLVYKSLVAEELLCIVGTYHPFASFNEVPIKSLNNQHIITTPKGSLTYNFIRKHLQQFKVKPTYVFMRNTESIKHAVEAGLGIALLSRKCIERDLLVGSLVAKKFKEVTLTRDVTMCYQKDWTNNKACRTFLNYINQEYYQIF